MQQTYDLSRVIVLSPEHQRKSIQFPRDTPVLVHSSDPLSALLNIMFSSSLNMYSQVQVRLNESLYPMITSTFVWLFMIENQT